MGIHLRTGLAAIIWTTTLLFPVQMAEAAPFFIGLGQGPFGDTITHSSNAISGDGSTVVGRNHSGANAGNTEAIRWTESLGTHSLGDLPDGPLFGGAEGVSADGSVVVGTGETQFGSEAFRWTAETGMQGLGDLPGGAVFSTAHGISGDGNVIVGRSTSNTGSQPFRWEASTGMVAIGGINNGAASAASYDGEVVVGWRTITIDQAFRWTEATGLELLGSLPGGGVSSRAYSVTPDGSVVVGGSSSSTGRQAFRWDASAGMVGLGDLHSTITDSEAYGVSADGNVIVGRASTNLESQVAFIWQEGVGMRLLQEVLEVDFGFDLSGWTLLQARGVSYDGLVVAGFAIDPTGRRQAFITSMREDIAIPEPAMFGLLGIGLVTLGFVRRRRR